MCKVWLLAVACVLPCCCRNIRFNYLEGLLGDLFTKFLAARGYIDSCSPVKFDQQGICSKSFEQRSLTFRPQRNCSDRVPGAFRTGQDIRTLGVCTSCEEQNKSDIGPPAAQCASPRAEATINSDYYVEDRYKPSNDLVQHAAGHSAFFRLKPSPDEFSFCWRVRDPPRLPKGIICYAACSELFPETSSQRYQPGQDVG